MTKQTAKAAYEPPEHVRRLKEELFSQELTPDEVAYALGMDPSTIFKYLREGRLVGYQLGRRWHVPVEAVREFRESLLEESQQRARNNDTTKRLRSVS